MTGSEPLDRQTSAAASYRARAGRPWSEEVVLCADGDGAEPALTSWLTWSRDLDALGHD